MNRQKCSACMCGDSQIVTIRVESEDGPEFFAFCAQHIPVGIAVLREIGDALDEDEKKTSGEDTKV